MFLECRPMSNTFDLYYSPMTVEDLDSLINDKLTERGWSYARLEREAGIANGLVAKILRGDRGLGRKTAAQLAEALNIPPETLYRVAGMIPVKNDEDPRLEIIEHLLGQLDADGRDEVVAYLEMKVKMQAKRDRLNTLEQSLVALEPEQKQEATKLLLEFLGSEGYTIRRVK